MICGYREYISKLSFESELVLLKYCNIDIPAYLDPYTKQIKVYLILLHAPHVTKQVNWQKKLSNCCDSPNLQKFFLFQSFLLYGISEF